MVYTLQKGVPTYELAPSYSLSAQVEKEMDPPHPPLEWRITGLCGPPSGSSLSTLKACSGESSQFRGQRRSGIESFLPCSEVCELQEPQIFHLQMKIETHRKWQQ